MTRADVDHVQAVVGGPLGELHVHILHASPKILASREIGIWCDPSLSPQERVLLLARQELDILTSGRVQSLQGHPHPWVRRICPPADGEHDEDQRFLPEVRGGGEGPHWRKVAHFETQLPEPRGARCTRNAQDAVHRTSCLEADLDRRSEDAPLPAKGRHRPAVALPEHALWSSRLVAKKHIRDATSSGSTGRAGPEGNLAFCKDAHRPREGIGGMPAQGSSTTATTSTSKCN
mmetsp:Transcript_154886/g.496302  ORF Transcript_154886/g.496302 Transcript_154886/m.496302 type:complete len:233 (+) Transcript_154886:49-747(+)